MGNFPTVAQLVAAQPGHRSYLTRTGGTTIAKALLDLGSTSASLTNAVPAAFTAPGAAAGAALTSASTGAIQLPNVPGGSKLYLSRARVRGANGPGGIWIYDRLVHTDSLVGNVTTVQTVNSAALPTRASGGDEVEAHLMAWTAAGGTAQASNVTVLYTDQSGNTAQSGLIYSGILTGNTLNSRGALYPVYLASGDTGIRVIESLQLATSTGTAGSLGFLLMKRLAYIPTPIQFEPAGADWIDLGLVEIATDACLSVAAGPAQITTSVIAWVELEFVIG